jgi:hypothetical protein
MIHGKVRSASVRTGVNDVVTRFVGEAELFPFYILHWQCEAKMGENSPVDTPKPGKVAGSSGNGKFAGRWKPAMVMQECLFWQ